MKSRILIGLIAGALGGFLGWILQENLVHYDAHVVASALPGRAVIKSALTGTEMRTLMLCVGGLIGLCLGSVDGLVEGNPRKIWQGMAISAVAGFLLGSAGFQIGSILYGVLKGSDIAAPGFAAFARLVLARAFGWSLMGLGLGVGSAISSRSALRIRNGAIGGLLGGFIGGFIFDLIANGSAPLQGALNSVPHDVGGPGRAIGFTAIGALTGFFIGLVDELLKQAWVKVLAGQNEGKDYTLIRSVNIIGRDERSDVPLFGDSSIAMEHAAIRSDGRRHVIVDAGSSIGTVVNGQQLPSRGELLLRDGDMIQIGAQRILFREKATAKRVGSNPLDAPKSKPAGPSNTPVPAHLCPFCGGNRDAAGNCLCSVSAGGAGSIANSGMGYNSIPSSPYGANTNAATIGSAMGRLVGIEGAAGQVFLLSGQNMEVGREQGKDIVISGNSTVSRNHARLTSEGGVFVVIDNGSANGTFVNNQRIARQNLAPGDIVQFGTSKFRFE